jgi:DNA/RNA-binding domain of Phe-tRNA-synthetase-like protein
MQFKYNDRVREKFPGLHVALGFISNLGTYDVNKFENKKNHVHEYLKATHSLETLKDAKKTRVYRDFFWSINIDPTKIRPAAEALIRRVLGGKEIPRINCVVDAYNLASMESGIALAAFNADKLKGDLTMHFARQGEEFLGIGMKGPKILQGNELIISDDKELIAIYPHRDADNTKVVKGVKKIVLLVCGVPGIDIEELNSTAKLAISYITQICGGSGEYQIF